MDIGAANGLGEAPVLVLGVDDRDLDARGRGSAATSSLAR